MRPQNHKPFMVNDLQQLSPSAASGMIRFIRGARVMLDSDLAALYGVTTKRLKEQLKRNQERFPDDFAFALNRQEVAAISSSYKKKTAGGRRYLPWAFTEHGAVMLASVLNTPVAVEASIRVVRAFVQLRELLTTSNELASKIAELQRSSGSHEAAIRKLFAAVDHLLATPASDQERREIGFHIKEEARKYRTRKTTRNGVH